MTPADDNLRKRLESFFRNPERCRQEYHEAWSLGKKAWEMCDDLRKERDALAAEDVREILIDAGVRFDEDAFIVEAGKVKPNLKRWAQEWRKLHKRIEKALATLAARDREVEERTWREAAEHTRNSSDDNWVCVTGLAEEFEAKAKEAGRKG